MSQPNPQATDLHTQKVQVMDRQDPMTDSDEDEDFLAGVVPQVNACPIDGSCESCQ